MNSLKLLIVEDDPDQRELICDTLESHFGPNTVDMACTISQALAADPAKYSLILSDFNLPDGSGLELLAEVRERCSTPVIIVTGENVGRTAVQAVRQGATDYVVKFGDYLLTIPLVVEKNLTLAKLARENETLRADLEQALRSVREKNLQLEQSLRRVEEMAATDPLTGLYNRRHFSRVLDQLFAESERFDSPLSSVMIDLDGYKQLNDSFGHAVGDQLLSLAGKVISANMRKMDVAARYGGDEFVLLLPHSSADDAALAARRIAEEFRQGSAILIKNNQGVTMSIGIASRRDSQCNNAEQLVAHADAALYQAKATGRNRAVLHAIK